jgi:hypothetical protein
MPTNYRTYQPEQSYLLPPSLSDWLPENHLAYFISEVVSVLDLSGFYARHHYCPVNLHDDCRNYK